jgi:uncharacterized protein (DUF1330 family)
MKRQITVLLALVASVGISAAAQAQTKKAFSVAEVEILDKGAYEALVKVVTPDIQKAGGQRLGTPFGRVIAREGVAPKAVIIIQWDSLEKAEGYLNSPLYKETEPQRAKAFKTSRSFLVEAGPNFTGFTFQGPKPAYWIREQEVTDQAALDRANANVGNPSAALQELSRQTGQRPSATAGQKIVARVGEAPKRFALQGFPTVEQAETFIKSPLNTAQGTKIIREYIIEAAP